MAGRAAGAGAREQEALLRASTPNWLRYLRRALGVHDEERAWRRGAEGEEHVGRILRKLDPVDWLVLHDLTLNANGSNLDHLVVGAPGVFALNTKHLTGRLWVGKSRILHNGQRTDYLRTSRWEAKTVAGLLEAAGVPGVTVQPILVVHGTVDVTIKQQPEGVLIMRPRETRRWLLRQEARFSAGDKPRLYAALINPSTWPVAQSAQSALSLGKATQVPGSSAST